MSDQKTGSQDQRRGGYGDSAGGADPAEPEQPSGSNASGRESPVTDTADADEALGNRTGGYGGSVPPEAPAPKD